MGIPGPVEILGKCIHKSMQIRCFVNRDIFFAGQGCCQVIDAESRLHCGKYVINFDIGNNICCMPYPFFRSVSFFISASYSSSYARRSIITGGLVECAGSRSLVSLIKISSSAIRFLISSTVFKDIKAPCVQFSIFH